MNGQTKRLGNVTYNLQINEGTVNYKQHTGVEWGYNYYPYHMN
jgi:hypothetical protein